MTDTELIALLEGDPEAGMAAVIEQYSGLLWKVASNRLQSREDIRDCVSETFSEFYLHRENYDPQKGALKSYLATIAHRCALRWQEDRFRQESAYREPPPQRDPFADLEQRTELDAALAQLDPEDEHILRMKYYHGMSAREIAASLGLPYETVKKRHQRSLKKLRMILTVGLVLVLWLCWRPARCWCCGILESLSAMASPPARKRWPIFCRTPSPSMRGSTSFM